MVASEATIRPAQSSAEEMANSITHGLGLLGSLIAAPLLLSAALESGDTRVLLGASAFAFSTILVYLSSTLYHATPPGELKQLFRMLDHGAIYLLIAGTYTPFMVVVMQGTLASLILGLEWTLAITCIVVKIAGGLSCRRNSTLVYLVMGWFIVVAIQPLMNSVPWDGLVLLFGGGFIYSLGVVFYQGNPFPFSHAVWHLCVIGGNTCHYFAVYRYAT